MYETVILKAAGNGEGEVQILNIIPKRSNHFAEDSKPASEIPTGDLGRNSLESNWHLLAQLANKFLELGEADAVDLKDVPNLDVNLRFEGIRNFSNGK